MSKMFLADGKKIEASGDFPVAPVADPEFVLTENVYESYHANPVDGTDDGKLRQLKFSEGQVLRASQIALLGLSEKKKAAAKKSDED